MIRIYRRRFSYRGQQWVVLGGGPGTINADFGYEIARLDGPGAVDGFFTMAEVRAYLSEAEANGWPLDDRAE